MKVFAVLTCCLALASASIFDDVLKASDLVKSLKEEGKNVLEQGKKMGESYIESAASLIISDMMKAMNSGKDASEALLKDGSVAIEVAKAFFGSKVEDLKDLVEVAHTELQALTDSVSTGAFIGEGLDALNKKADKVIQDFEQKVQGKLSEMSTGLSGVFQGLVEKYLKNEAQKVLSGIRSRRFIKDLWESVKNATASAGSAIAEAFKPHVDTVVSAAKTLHQTLKGHASNLWNAVSGHVNTLSDKLSGHVQDLKDKGNLLVQHGTDALTALKAAAAEILGQTFHNMNHTIHGMINTGKDAAGTVVDHFTGGK
ncbi:uncharacterized protein LOC106157198 [Lingula anatina]|uniref:Uncharacterized protein LOC106157198 n=1 Tax=Lingula anatina TaxID=7574 RepID=A0A1S3HT47_LINAN|nr:uncharacterized protein LOC106157198 [Lingula anatina]|eukprot:XP_013388229.1 uncharacterized protein LOC106157198 [Lingula anatina]